MSPSPPTGEHSQVNPNDARAWYLLADVLAREPGDPGVLEAYERVRSLDDRLADQLLEKHRDALSRFSTKDPVGCS